MKTTWHVAVSLAAGLILAGAVPGQEKDNAQKTQEQDYTALVQDLVVNQNVLEGQNLLTLSLANALVSSNDLGVDVAELQPALRAQLNLAEGTGLVVTGVPDESPGAKAGMKAHDVLVKVGGAGVGNTEQLAEALKKSEGKPLKLELIRQGKLLTVQATPKSAVVAEVVLSDVPVRAWTELPVRLPEERYRIGVVLSEADETLRAQVGLAAGEGLVVTEVYPDTPAAKAGIQPHDVLVILDGKRLTSVDSINAQIQEIKDREVELKLLRGGKESALKIAPKRETDATQWSEFHRGLTVWRADHCPVHATVNCRNCHADPFPGQQVGKYYDRLLLSRWIGADKDAAAGPQQQVAQLKEQLAKMQETLADLEVKLQAAKETEGKKEKESEEKPKK